MMNLYLKLLKRYFKYCRLSAEKAARLSLRKNRDLNDLVKEVNKQSESTGLSNVGYLRLYQMLRNIKPEYVLECGTGKSTFIIAHAMSQNGNGRKIVTMEESEEWAKKQRELLANVFSHKKANVWFPGRTKNLIELVHSTITIERHRIWAGSCYENIIDYPYTFIMVDGPQLTEEYFINVDLINILKRSNSPVSVWIDGRWATVAMCRALFGDKVISKPGWKHTEIYSATREDIFRDLKFIRKEMFMMAKGR
jgi:hypothetical protein